MKYIILVLTCLFMTTSAEARQHHRHHHYRHIHVAQTVPTVNFFEGLFSAPRPTTAKTPSARRDSSGSVTMLPHPSGCPTRAFCGCGASVAVFGRSVRTLWLASAWFKYPPTSPASGMVAVRRHHVFVLRQHIEGDTWLVEDYNSGRHASRLHPRRIAGYSIRNPHA